MKKYTGYALKALSLLLCFVMLAAGCALAEDSPEDEPAVEPSETVTENIEVEGTEDEEEDTGDTTEASIEGLTPLYRTVIKAFINNGRGIWMRKYQSTESDKVCFVPTGETITIYQVNPAYVIAEYGGNVGYVKRTWVDENCEAIDPVNTVPYAVVPSQFVATLTETVDVHSKPSASSSVYPIHPGAGSKIAILEFDSGYAKVLYWRNYGYIDATKLTDLVTVSPTLEPLSAETPIAAFCSFFAYNTHTEGNEGRCKNIVRSCESMSRTMQPGDKLNFNSDVGPYKKSNGYFPAPILIAGGSQIGYGGGTCQSSSTLYNTVRQIPGVTVLMRRPHGPGCARYLPMHQDAAVGSPALNFIFRNDCDFAIRIVAESTGEGTLCIQIFREEAAR